jgi:CRP-like cAMP-binding protein
MPPKVAAGTTPASPPFDLDTSLESAGTSRRVIRFRRPAVVFAQGAVANAVFYIQSGSVQLSVVSATGREAIVGMLGPGDFFGEGCLVAQPHRIGTARTVMPTSVLRIGRAEMVRTLHRQPQFADRFLKHILARNTRVEEDLVDARARATARSRTA